MWRWIEDWVFRKVTGWDWRRVLPWEFGRVVGRRAWVCMGGRGILPKYLRVECGLEWLECWLTC